MTAQKLLIIFGLVLVAIGILWPLISKLGLGRLPGPHIAGGYGSVESDSDGWLVKRAVSPLTRGVTVRSPQVRPVAHGEQIALMRCKSLCTNDTGTASPNRGHRRHMQAGLERAHRLEAA